MTPSVQKHLFLAYYTRANFIKTEMLPEYDNKYCFLMLIISKCLSKQERLCSVLLKLLMFFAVPEKYDSV